MREKFDRNFVTYDRETVRTHRKFHPDQNVWKQEDLIITSIDFAKRTTDDPESDRVSSRYRNYSNGGRIRNAKRRPVRRS